MDIKICKICSKEKPVNEFNSKGSRNNKIFYDSKCKVCEWFSKRIINYNESIWCKLDDETIIDSLLNHKANINQISNILNKSLYDICDRIKNVLRLSGQIKLPLLLVNRQTPLVFKLFKTKSERLNEKTPLLMVMR